MVVRGETRVRPAQRGGLHRRRPPLPAAAKARARRHREQGLVARQRPGVAASGQGTAARRRWGLAKTLAAAVLFAVVFAFARTTWRIWQLGRAIEATQHEIEVTRLRQHQLESELERWNDPAVIAEEARRELGLVLPGEMRFVPAKPVPPGDPFHVEKRPSPERPLD